MKIILLAGYVLIASGCVGNSTIRNNRKDPLTEAQIEYGKELINDMVLLEQVCGLFTFTYTHFHTNTLMDIYLAEVVFKSTHMSMLLFEDYYRHVADSLIFAYDNYYMFAYFSGGNNYRAEGYHVIKVLPVTP